MTFEELQNVLLAAITPLAEGKPVVWKQQDAPRPGEQYVGLYAPRLLRESEPEERQDVVEGLDVSRQRLHYGCMLDIEVFGDDAMNDLWKIQRGLYLADTRELLGDVALVNTEDPIDTTTLLDEQWEARARFTAQFRVAVEATPLVGVIETVNLKRDLAMPGATP